MGLSGDSSERGNETLPAEGSQPKPGEGRSGQVTWDGGAEGHTVVVEGLTRRHLEGGWLLAERPGGECTGQSDAQRPPEHFLLKSLSKSSLAGEKDKGKGPSAGAPPPWTDPRPGLVRLGIVQPIRQKSKLCGDKLNWRARNSDKGQQPSSGQRGRGDHGQEDQEYPL